MANLQISTIRQLKDVPALRQLLVLIGIAAAVAAGLWFWNWSQQPGYTPVFSNLSDKDAAEAAETLRTADIPYRTESGGIAVPQARLYDARLKLAAQGLPRDGSQGFELIQQEQGFGTSQFIETARYQHALETELARTIGGLQPVRGARVHLAIPKPSAFARKTDAPGASVFIELYAGRSLESDQVSSIVHLVASSVPGLIPSAVTVIDQFGHLLTNADPDSALARSAEQFDYARRVESDYAHRIEQLLTPMVGVGRVNAQVAADMDFSEIEEAREQYAPDPQKIRSEQINQDTTRGGKTSGGIPGATSNQPPPQNAHPPLNNAAATAVAAAAANAADDIQTQSKQESRTYELDRTLSHTRQSVGRLKRLSVAVLVDHVPKLIGAGDKQEMKPAPLSAEDLAKVESLVKEAVGFDAARGDTVSVQNTSFITQDAPVIEALPIWQQPRVRDYAQQGGGILAVLALIVFILRPALRNLMNAPLQRLRGAEAGGAALTASAAGGALPDDRLSLSAAPLELPRGGYEQKLQIARKAVTEDPKRVAQVVKTWIGEEGG